MYGAKDRVLLVNIKTPKEWFWVHSAQICSVWYSQMAMPMRRCAHYTMYILRTHSMQTRSWDFGGGRRRQRAAVCRGINRRERVTCRARKNHSQKRTHAHITPTSFCGCVMCSLVLMVKLWAPNPKPHATLRVYCKGQQTYDFCQVLGSACFNLADADCECVALMDLCSKYKRFCIVYMYDH